MSRGGRRENENSERRYSDLANVDHFTQPVERIGHRTPYNGAAAEAQSRDLRVFALELPQAGELHRGDERGDATHGAGRELSECAHQIGLAKYARDSLLAVCAGQIALSGGTRTSNVQYVLQPQDRR